MKHEDFYERYGEVMYDERDVIEKFLKTQYDLRYGRQRDTWHFEPAVEVIARNGSLVQIHDIKMDKDRFVVFYVDAFMEKDWWECTDFAYGELSKVLDALPDADDIVWTNAVCDLKVMARSYRNDLLFAEYPFKYEIDGNFYTLDDIKITDDGTLCLVQALGNSAPVSDFSLDVLVNLRDHINISVLHASKEYKKLMELLALEENMRFECANYGDTTFVMKGTDMTFDVSSVRRDDNGNLVIYGNDIDADVCDYIELTEKEIRHEYLVSIIEQIEKSKYHDIMDFYNGHNKELVRKINTAWKSCKYHNMFSEILLALLVRDHEEYIDKYCEIDDYSGDWAMAHAHEIMEGVCDDMDLETILSFIRYKE